MLKIKRILGLGLIAVIALIATVDGIVMIDRPLMHDDLNYAMHNAEWLETHHPALLRLPTHIIGSWLDVNGRFADSLNIIWLGMMDAPMRGLLCAVMMGLFYIGFLIWTLKSGGGTILATVVTAILLFLLPWWDWGQMFVVQFNYVWGSSFMLIWLLVIFTVRLNRAGGWIALIAGILVAGMHEASGVAMAIAFVWTLISGRFGGRKIYPSRWNALAAWGGIAGGIYSISSPGIWSRFSEMTVKENGMITVWMTSDWMVVLSVGVIIGLWIWRRGYLKRLCESASGCRIIFFTIAAIISAGISGMSGFVGRSGWYAQCFALLALIQIYADFRSALESTGIMHRNGMLIRGIKYMIAVSLLILMAGHIMLFYQRQRELNLDAAKAIEGYIRNPEEPIYYDFPRPEREKWYLLAKPTGMIPAYDAWNEYVMTEGYSDGEHLPVILPRKYQGVKIPEKDIVRVSREDRDKRLVKEGDKLYFLSRMPGALRSDTTDLRRIKIEVSLRPGDRIATINPTPRF